MKLSKQTVYFLCRFILAGCVAQTADAAIAYTEHPGGTLNADETWEPGTHCVAGHLTVANGVRLTVQPGAVVKFNNGSQLTVSGSLNAEGTDTGEIVITSINDDNYGEICPGSSGEPGPGDWRGIYLYGYSSNQGIGEFDHCRIRYGGSTLTTFDSNVCFYYSDSGHFYHSISEFSATDGILISSASPQIDASHIRDNDRHGLYAAGAGAPSLTDNVFTDNKGYAVYMDTKSVPAGAHDNTGSGNGINGFVLFGNVDRDQTWWRFGSPDFPIVLDNHMTVYNAVTLAISAGTVVKCSAGVQFTVNGKLDVNGADGQEVVFTSLYDDTFDGDTNADGNATAPSEGDWRGIYLYGYSSNQGIGEFDHCRIRYGGSTLTTFDSNVCFYYSDSGHFYHSVSEFSATDGIRVSNVAPPVINADIVNNKQHGLYCYNCASQILNSVFWNNAAEQIFSNVGDQPRVDYSDIQGGYPGEGNIDADPLFVDMAQSDYRLQQCSPCIDKGDPVEVLAVDYTTGSLVLTVDDVTHVEPGDFLWITDGVNVESGVAAGASATSILLENGFLNDYRTADGAHAFTFKSDYTLEPVPNGRRINLGAYGGSHLSAICPCSGDFEPDGDSDGRDLSIFMADFGRTDCMAAGDCAGDFDSDGDVDKDDLEAIAANYGKLDCFN